MSLADILILIFAFLAVGGGVAYGFYRRSRRKQGKSCPGCGGGCAGCPSRDENSRKGEDNR